MDYITSALLIGGGRVGAEVSIVVVTTNNASTSYVTAEYRWYKSTSYGGVYERISGAYGSKYTVRPGDMFIRCVVTGYGEYAGTAESNIIIIQDPRELITNNNITSNARISYIGNGLELESMVSEITGKSNIVTDIQRINQSIRMILSTSRGEVPMLLQLGTNLPEKVFEGITDALLDSIQLEVESALTEQEPRIKLLQVNVTTDYDHTVSVEINYNILNTNITSSYIYNIDLVGGDGTV